MKTNLQILSSVHDRKSFDCGNTELNQFFQKYASQHHKKNISKTFVLLNEDAEILGFFTISTASLDFQSLNEKIINKFPKHPIPCALIGRVAIDLKYQGNGLGALILAYALQKIATLSEQIGISMVLIDAKNEKVAQFYKKLGFIELEKHPLRLFYMVSEIPNNK